jgi:predicted transcriptional regulator
VERIKIELSRELSERVAVAARAECGTPHAYVAAILEQHVPLLKRRETQVDARLPILAAFLGFSARQN